MFDYINTKKDTKYYDILGIKQDAKIEEIKKVYKKLALKFHPDRNLDNREEAETKFKEITEAYTILSNPNKRKNYDMYGINTGNDSSNIFGSGNVNPFEMFNNIFKTQVSEFMNNNRGSSGINFDNILNELKSTNMKRDFTFGGMKFKINVNEPKPKFKSSFGDNKKVESVGKDWDNKQGVGPIDLKPKEQIITHHFELSDIYSGATKSIDIELTRRFKIKNKIIYKKIKRKLNIPLKGREIFAENFGSHQKGFKKASDLLIIIDDKPNEVFKRVGNYNLLSLQSFDLNNLNEKLSIKLPDNTSFTITIKPNELRENIKKNMLIKINGKGLPFMVNGEMKRGDLFVKIDDSQSKNLDKNTNDDSDNNDENYEFIHIFNLFN